MKRGKRNELRAAGFKPVPLFDLWIDDKQAQSAISMRATILATIKQIEHEKQAARLVPSYAVCWEVCRRLRIERAVLLSELETMKSERVVFGIGNTLSDNYILLQPLKNYLL
jgi:hypothetical protein